MAFLLNCFPHKPREMKSGNAESNSLLIECDFPKSTSYIKTIEDTYCLEANASCSLQHLPPQAWQYVSSLGISVLELHRWRERASRVTSS